MPAAASTATYDIVVDFTGGQLGDVHLDVTLTLDTALTYTGETEGLVVNHLTSSVVADDPFALGLGTPLAFDYTASGSLFFGTGNVTGVASSVVDFALEIADFLTSPAVDYCWDSDAAQDAIARCSGVSLSITEAPQVPLPAGLPLLLTGLAGVGILRRRKPA